MTAKELKELLTPEKIIKILEEVGCHNVRKDGNTIKAANPDGNKPTAICCYIDNDNLNCEDFTRAIFQQRRCRDIIALVEFLCKLSFSKAMRKITNILGLSYFYEPKQQKPSFLKFLDFVETGKKETEEDILKSFPENILNQFVKIPNRKWLDEGISEKTQKYWECFLDVISQRIIFPIREESAGEIVGVKGRLLDDELIDKNKYFPIYVYPKGKILFGAWQNEKYIKEKSEVIVVESEKSVIKLWGIGIKNVVAIGGKCISEVQAEKLLRMNVTITLALDKDVTEEEVYENIKKLMYPVKTVNIFIIKDEANLMKKEKESPCDNVDTWRILYSVYRKEVPVIEWKNNG
ncbi:Conserved hypothetical protein [Clostridium acetobutylicum EA 2018]|uniref:toprim domain-containing protein n=1 Tax=Clostridium acetobutylicum TaxID=1488 RepID=UPI000200A697|nr:toprim domain-containing protein [Clostridium acetobutylicum]ADZ20247.1 Conserved hypothetical protein [Clostridium acetobutylicum EA 2018]